MKKYLLHIEQAGKGPPVVFLHGMIGSSSYWRYFLERTPLAHRLIAPDLLGFGDSPKPATATYSLESHAASIIYTLEQNGVREPFVLVGHSMGALIALRLARAYPKKVRKLILCGMPIYTSAAEARKVITGSGIVPKLMTEGPAARAVCAFMCRFRPLVRKLLPLYYPQLPPEVAADSTKHTWYSYSRSLTAIINQQNVLTDLRQLNVPAVLLIGSRDKLMKYENLARIPRRVEVRVIDGATHHLPLSHPNEIQRLLDG